MSISPVLEGLDEFDSEETTAITKVESTKDFRPQRRRFPGDGLIEAVHLQRPPGSSAVTLSGRSAASEADLILNAWARSLKRGTSDAVQFTVRFGDGFAYRGILHIRKRGHRDLLSYLRDEKNFRAAFCPDLTRKQAAVMFHVFRTSYDLSGTRSEPTQGADLLTFRPCAA